MRQLYRGSPVSNRHPSPLPYDVCVQMIKHYRDVNNSDAGAISNGAGHRFEPCAAQQNYQLNLNCCEARWLGE